jgi:hypothetical protein
MGKSAHEFLYQPDKINCHICYLYSAWSQTKSASSMRRLTGEVYTRSVHSCSRHGPATARLTSERPGIGIPVPKTFTLLQYVVYRSVMLHHFIYWLSFTVLFVRIFWHSISLHPLKKPEGSCEIQSNVFDMDIRDSPSSVRCASSITSCLFSTRDKGIKLADEINTRTFLSNVTQLQKVVLFHLNVSRSLQLVIVITAACEWVWNVEETISNVKGSTGKKPCPIFSVITISPELSCNRTRCRL